MAHFSEHREILRHGWRANATVDYHAPIQHSKIAFPLIIREWIPSVEDEPRHVRLPFGNRNAMLFATSFHASPLAGVQWSLRFGSVNRPSQDLVAPAIDLLSSVCRSLGRT